LIVQIIDMDDQHWV